MKLATLCVLDNQEELAATPRDSEFIQSRFHRHRVLLNSWFTYTESSLTEVLHTATQTEQPFPRLPYVAHNAHRIPHTHSTCNTHLPTQHKTPCVYTLSLWSATVHNKTSKYTHQTGLHTTVPMIKKHELGGNEFANMPK